MPVLTGIVLPLALVLVAVVLPTVAFLGYVTSGLLIGTVLVNAG